MKFAGASGVRLQQCTSFCDSNCWGRRTSLVFSRINGIYEHTVFHCGYFLFPPKLSLFYPLLAACLGLLHYHGTGLVGARRDCLLLLLAGYGLIFFPSSMNCINHRAECYHCASSTAFRRARAFPR
ncbi:hypothetical protein AOQ84DRAFT_8606 [Glonium stellatum]|uniref:Uncharacterized protein n=1 Tax=Glonium stellatum TaxID=574774 RepID=A0A8E2F3W0_9PEZI|nr:hypothetical protein AOQ84DRAFT_8606 [Glonium stellatum]